MDKVLNINDIPNLRGNQYPARISVSLTSDAKRKLDALKRNKSKDTAALVRMLIDDFLKNVEFDDAG